MPHETDDLRISQLKELLPPLHILGQFPVTEKAGTLTFQTRQDIHRILRGDDDRLLVVIGPCSIHDPEAAIEYAHRLKEQKDRLHSDLLVVMRVYFEKPRTTVGWKGLINDPYLDGSFKINDGLRIGRKLLLDLNEIGVPAGVEYLDMISPQYVADLVSWGAIGARTTESQVHRELASGLSCPVGFKNGTDGNLKIAVDAIRTSQNPHHFLSVNKAGHSAIVATTGNQDCHIILRGGKRPNYDAASIQSSSRELSLAGLPERVMIDMSHANSQKQHLRQLEVGRNIASQIGDGDERIFGVMIESYLLEGRQNLKDPRDLVYGQSITDACLGWDASIPLLDMLADAVRSRRDSRKTTAPGKETRQAL